MTPEVIITTGFVVFGIAFAIWLMPVLIQENREKKARIAARRREIEEDPRWHGLFRVVRVERAGGSVSYNIEGWNGFEKGWARPPYGRSTMDGEWCWKFEDFSSAEEAASLIDRKLAEDRAGIIKSVTVVALRQALATAE